MSATYWRKVPSTTSGSELIWAKRLITIGDDMSSVIRALDDARAEYKKMRRLEKYAHKMIVSGSTALLLICSTAIVFPDILPALIPALLALAFGGAVWGYLAYGDRVGAARAAVRAAEDHQEKVTGVKE